MIDTNTILAQVAELGTDGTAFLLSVFMVVGYYARHRREAEKNPRYSIHKVNALARRLWTENVMSSSGKDVMAVQTLRNFIMVSIMMATTASMLIIGTLTLTGQAENITRTWHVIGMGGSHSANLWIFKVMCLLVDFIVAFFSYTFSMRHATHVLFMINVPEAGYSQHAELSPERVAAKLISAGNMIAVGMRAFLFAIPLVFWLFGPVFLLLATMGLIVTLYQIDRHDIVDSHSSLASRGKAQKAVNEQFPEHGVLTLGQDSAA